MTSFPITHKKEYRPAQDPQVINELDALIDCSRQTNYPTNTSRLMSFFVGCGVYPDDVSEHYKIREQTRKIAPHFSVEKHRKTPSKRAKEYSIFFHMTSLANEHPIEYQLVDQGLQTQNFRTFFRTANGRFLKAHQDDQKGIPDTFYNFTASVDRKGEQSAKIYAYTKELQFFSDKETRSETARKVCNKASEFYQSLGLLEKDAHPDYVFGLANNIHLMNAGENSVAFGFNMKDIVSLDQGLEIMVNVGLSRPAFTDKVDVKPKFEAVLSSMGINFLNP